MYKPQNEHTPCCWNYSKEEQRLRRRCEKTARRGGPSRKLKMAKPVKLLHLFIFKHCYPEVKIRPTRLPTWTLKLDRKCLGYSNLFPPLLLFGDLHSDFLNTVVFEPKATWKPFSMDPYWWSLVVITGAGGAHEFCTCPTLKANSGAKCWLKTSPCWQLCA